MDTAAPASQTTGGLDLKSGGTGSATTATGDMAGSVASTTVAGHVLAQKPWFSLSRLYSWYIPTNELQRRRAEADLLADIRPEYPDYPQNTFPNQPELGSKTNAEIRLVDLGDGKSYINTLKIEGPDNGRPKQVLVMAHGFGAGLGFFYPLYPTLAQVPGWRIYSIDWLGMGLSSRPKFHVRMRHGERQDEMVKEAEDWFVDSLEKWRIRQNISSFTLLGHSLGGYLMAIYALKYPDRVDKLLLVSPGVCSLFLVSTCCSTCWL